MASSTSWPSTILTYAYGTPFDRSVAITISLGTVSKAFSKSMNLRAILLCNSSLFSTICLRTYIPCVVPLPFMNPCCSPEVTFYSSHDPLKLDVQLWWPICNTSVFPRFIFSPCQVNSPFYSSSVSCSSCLPFATRARSSA